MHHFCFFSDISIHSLRMEGDSKENIVSSPFRKFQSTPSAWRETLLLPFFLFSRSHFNPLPPHGGRPVLTSILRSNPAFQSTPSAWRETSFSIKLSSDLIFQSTPSAWRETWPPHMCRVVLPYFNPLPPHGGRHWIDGFFDKFAKISIHSLRMEGDAYSTMLFSTIKSFQSTPSAWRETHTAEQYDGQENAFQSTPSAWRETTQNMLRGVC